MVEYNLVPSPQLVAGCDNEFYFGNVLEADIDSVGMVRKIEPMRKWAKQQQHDKRPSTSVSIWDIQEYATLSIEDSWYWPITESI